MIICIFIYFFNQTVFIGPFFSHYLTDSTATVFVVIKQSRHFQRIAPCNRERERECVCGMRVKCMHRTRLHQKFISCINDKLSNFLEPITIVDCFSNITKFLIFTLLRNFHEDQMSLLLTYHTLSVSPHAYHCYHCLIMKCFIVKDANFYIMIFRVKMTF